MPAGNSRLCLKAMAWICRAVLPYDWQVSERGGLRVQDGFFARFCIDRLGAGVQFLRDNPAGAPVATFQVPDEVSHEACAP